jgi:uncharacterized protein YbaP (TraB family)
MKVRLLILSLIGLSLFNAAQGQLLWKISLKGLSGESYLFGTHHLIDKDMIPHIDTILTISSHTDAIVGEMDMNLPGMQGKLMKASLLKGTNMKKLVSAEDYQLLDREFKSLLGMGMKLLGIYKPMMLVTMHQVGMYIRSTGKIKQPVSVDELLQKQARQAKKRVVGLETPDFQMKVLFNSIPLERQVEILMYEIREKERVVSDLKQLNEAYTAGDLETMGALDIEDASMNPEERKLLVDDRNAEWLKQLPELIRKQSCFIAVGCLHLVGPKGLIDQLRTMGYTVEPVAFQ